MKIIFLDIDGVLINRNSLRVANGFNAKPDPACVRALNEIVRRTRAKIVVSSIWRLRGETEICRLLVDWGVRGGAFDITPDLTKTYGMLFTAVQRGDEIQAWLDEHKNVKNFVIIDDGNDMKHLRDRLIQTDFETGLCLEHVERAVGMLNKSRRKSRDEEVNHAGVS